MLQSTNLKSLMNIQEVGSFRGYKMAFLHNSYYCEALKLFGFSSEHSLKMAITRAVKKQMATRANPDRPAFGSPPFGK
jgi:hypothetical protein